MGAVHALDRTLQKSTIAIVTAGGVHLKDQELQYAMRLATSATASSPGPNPISDGHTSSLRHTDADGTSLVFFPLTCADLETECFIGGIALTSANGLHMQLRRGTGTAPAIANEIASLARRPRRLRGDPTSFTARSWRSTRIERPVYSTG